MANTPIISVPELAGISSLVWSLGDQNASGDTITTTLKGKADFGALFNNDIFSSLRESRVGEYGWYAGHSVAHGYGRQFDEVTMTVIELNVNYNKNGYYSRFEASNRTEARPLEEKVGAINSGTPTVDETYAVWWNHRVIGTGGDLTTLQKDTLKAKTSLEGGTGIDNTAWLKTNQALPQSKTTAGSEARVLMEARFPGVQSYGVPALQVKEVIYARTEQIVQNQVAAVGYLAAPIDSAGNYYDVDRFGTDATKWLVTSASYRKRLGWYEAEMNYAYAKNGWLAKDAASGKSGVYPRYYG